MGAKKSKPVPDPGLISTEEALETYYEAKVRPVELSHLYEDFASPPLDPAEFHANPAVLLLGQYSSGKTTMINHLLGDTYPGSTIGPEPTTDVFVFISHGTSTSSVTGPALVSDKDFPFRAISKFGTDFLGKLRGATLTAPMLKHITFIDTPGILSGAKQRTQRGYDFHKVIKFLAEKVDRIWVLFDTSKMDISDEFKLVLGCLAGNDEKVRIILNKADAVTAEELVRVRGALMWNLGKIMTTPEVPSVLIGSFTDEEVAVRTELTDAFTAAKAKLLADLHELPETTSMRKLTDVVKRARRVEVHALIIDAIVRQAACLCAGKQGAVRKWTQDRFMRRLFTDLEITEKVNPFDFPDIEEFRTSAEHSDVRKWVRLKPADRTRLQEFIHTDVTNIVEARKLKGLGPGKKTAGMEQEQAPTEPTKKRKKKAKKLEEEEEEGPTTKKDDDKEQEVKTPPHVPTPTPTPDPVQSKSMY